MLKSSTRTEPRGYDVNRAMHLAWPDLAVIAVYLIRHCRPGPPGLEEEKVQDGRERRIFLAGGTLGWGVIGLALFSTNISTIHLVSLARRLCQRPGLRQFRVDGRFLLIVLSFFFRPVLYPFAGGHAARFSWRNATAGPAVTGWPFCPFYRRFSSTSAFPFTRAPWFLKGCSDRHQRQHHPDRRVDGSLHDRRGLLAVVLTESVQTVILIAGAACVVVIGLVQTGGWSGMAAAVEPVKLTVLRTAAQTPTLPWYAVFLGYPVIGLCTGAPTRPSSSASWGQGRAQRPAGAAFRRVHQDPSVFLFVLPGVIAAALVKQGKLPAFENSADTYSVLINHLLPVGLKGVVAAALLAALMSTVSGALNSIATLFSLDLYKRWRPATSEKKLTRIGRVVTFVAMVAAILWSPLIIHFQSIFQGVTA